MPIATNKSGYTGVSWNPARQKWETSLKVKGVRVLRDFFDDKEAAARA